MDRCGRAANVAVVIVLNGGDSRSAQRRAEPNRNGAIALRDLGCLHLARPVLGYCAVNLQAAYFAVH
jgi:hypothetical protein